MNKLFLILIISTPLLAECRIQEGISIARPGAQWTLRGDSYSGLEWIDRSSSKPTENEINSAIQNCRNAESTRESAKDQATKDVKNTSLTPQQRLDALMIYLGIN